MLTITNMSRLVLQRRTISKSPCNWLSLQSDFLQYEKYFIRNCVCTWSKHPM